LNDGHEPEDNKLEVIIEKLRNGNVGGSVFLDFDAFPGRG